MRWSQFVNDAVERASAMARQSARKGDWASVQVHARDIINRHRKSAEGYFLLGLAENGKRRPTHAVRAFTRAIELEEGRYDAAIELAGLFLRNNQYKDAVELLDRFVPLLNDSPLYLDMAGTIYVNAGLPEKGWPLFQRADELKPDAPAIQANLAACAVYVGEIDTAIALYRQLLGRFPQHQRHHYELSRLLRADDTSHIDEMQAVLKAPGRDSDNDIYMNYALGKEYEDLGRWKEAFAHYKRAGDEAAKLANYDVRDDLAVIEEISGVCDSAWIADGADTARSSHSEKTPIFIVGLPRSGTTLTERILSCHSQIESAGESFLLQVAIKQASADRSSVMMTPSMISAAAGRNIADIASAYLTSVSYKFGHKPMFIEKLPENFLYLGFVAKAFPNARIVHLNRQPMDICFALYKQSFFRYAYSLDDLGRYYVAFAALRDHWRSVLGDRLIEVDYEDLVANQERETRRLLDRIGVDFEDECLHFEQNQAASNTASTVQIREKIHSRSVGRWRHFATELRPLADHLRDAGIDPG